MRAVHAAHIMPYVNFDASPCPFFLLWLLLLLQEDAKMQVNEKHHI